MTDATPPQNDDELLSEAVRLRRAVNRRVLPIYAFVAALVAVVIGVGVNFNADNNRSCKSAQQNRDLLKLVITTAYNSPTGQINLKSLDGYAQLDPATKKWVDSFQGLISLGNGSVPGDKDGNRVPDKVDAVLSASIC